jgi:hypothetical protein
MSDQAKLDTGKITLLDIDVSRELYKLERNHRLIGSIQFLASKALEDFILVLIESQRPVNLNEITTINQDLKHVFAKEVRIIEKNVSQTKIIQELLLPKKVTSYSSVWLPDGSRFIKVKLDNGSRMNQAYTAKLNLITRDVLGFEVFVEGE